MFYFESMTTVFILTLSPFIPRRQYLAGVILPKVFDKQTGVKSAYESQLLFVLNCDKRARRRNIFRPRPTRLTPRIFFKFI